jgi:cephalosporin-C deacetylase-like acetyl esterase
MKKIKNKYTKIVLVLILLGFFFLATSFSSIYLYKNGHLNFLRKYYYSINPGDDPLLHIEEDNLALYNDLKITQPELRVDYTDMDSFKKWQIQARDKFKELLGSNNDGEFNKQSINIISEEPIDNNIKRLKISYLSNDNIEIPCYLFIHKDNEKRPAILIIPGHGDFKQTAGLIEAKNKYFELDYNSGYQNANAEYLAKQGFVTLTCEQRGFGELGRLSPHAIMANAILVGRSYQGVLIDDHISEVTLLQSFKQVNDSKIGVAGVSLGGEQALYLGAVDERIKAVVSMGWLSNHDILIYKNIDIDAIIPSLLNYFDQESIASLIAPRAALYSNGEEEILKGPGWFNSEDAIETTNEIEKSYALFDKEDNVAYVEHPGNHVFDNEVALEFFKKHLN